MAVNEVIVNGEVIVDLKSDTVTPETLAEGTTAHDASGRSITGTGSLGAVRYDKTQSLTEAQKAQARENIGVEEQIVHEYAESLEWIEANGDTSKVYVLPDGTAYAYKLIQKEVEGGGYTNILETYKPQINKRWSFSSNAVSSQNGYMLIGPVPVKAEDVVRINRAYEAGDMFFQSGYCRIHYLNTSGAKVSGTNDRAPYLDEKLIIEENATAWVVGYVNATSGDSNSNTKIAGYDDIAQMVAVFAINEGTVLTEADVAGYIMTINEEIKEGSTTVVEEYAWVTCEDRIIILEETTRKHTEKISALQEAIESGNSNPLTEAEKIEKVKTWDKPVYDHAEVTLVADGNEKPALTTSDRTISAIYAKYRALMAAHPDFITETNLGKCTGSSTFTAVDMLRFDFKERDGLTQPDLGESALHETKPKLIFMSGVHTEWVGVWGLYYALEEIATNPEFEDIRRNAHIIVVPCANPFCLTTQTAVEGWRMSHVNANGVAIHNNFNVDHSTSGAVGEYNYGGSAPCSELETQYIDKIMADNPDAVAFISCHNNDYSTYYGSHVIWASSATYHMCNLVFRLVDKMSKAWINRYGQTLKDSIDEYKINMDADDYRLGRATMSSSKGTEQKNALKYGIQGVNVEISRMMKVFSGNTDGTSEVMTHGAEVYANLIRTILMAYENSDKASYYL